MNGTDDYPATMTIEEAGGLLGLSRGSAYRAAARGELPTFRFRRRLLVPTARLLATLGFDDRRHPEGADATSGVPQP
jgi:excisionase family DNA binding protein